MQLDLRLFIIIWICRNNIEFFEWTSKVHELIRKPQMEYANPVAITFKSTGKV